jgi:hypothetical protein
MNGNLRRIPIVNIPGRILVVLGKACAWKGRWKERELGGTGLPGGTSSKPFPLALSCGFNLDATEERYNQDPPLSIHPKISPFYPVCCP